MKPLASGHDEDPQVGPDKVQMLNQQTGRHFEFFILAIPFFPSSLKHPLRIKHVIRHGIKMCIIFSPSFVWFYKTILRRAYVI